jgi:predicted hydrolase (HD superfamily)
MITREEAWALLTKYNREDFHLRHAQTVEGVMRYFARSLGYGDEADFWALVGLLHDLDFEMYPEEHCIRQQQKMEKVLYAVDELTGLIGAVAIMRPSKSVTDLEVPSVRKKYKSANFAAGCSREVIERGAAMLGWELNTLIERTILAMRSLETDA